LARQAVFLLLHVRKSRVDEMIGVFSSRELAEASARIYTPDVVFTETYGKTWISPFGGTGEHHWEIHEFELNSRHG